MLSEKELPAQTFEQPRWLSVQSDRLAADPVTRFATPRFGPPPRSWKLAIFKAALLLLMLSCFGRPGDAQEQGGESLLEVDGGKAFTDPSEEMRIKFNGNATLGYNVSFERQVTGKWLRIAQFPTGAVWSAFSAWDDPHNPASAHWFSGEHDFKAQKVQQMEPGHVLAEGTGSIEGQPWEFEDLYSFEHGAVKVVRRWHHIGPDSQSPITLVTAVRVPVQDDARVVFPGILYNGNPGAYPAMPVPHFPFIADAKALYEEHRFPVPFVDVESTVEGRRLYASLLTIPSRVAQGHRGEDQWWSLGVERRWDASADILNVSGAVMTNGLPSTIYGHRNGFDPYDQAYLDVRGDVTFEKTFYIDYGLSPRTGYAFRQTIWKAFEIFRPTDTPHISFEKAMDLKLQRVREVYYRGADGVAGIPLVPKAHRFMYGWVGDDLATAYALLDAGQRTNNEEERRMGLDAVNFFVDHTRRDTPGLLYGDYDYVQKKWVTSFFYGWNWPESISSRQLGEIADRLSDLVLWARKHDMPEEASRWEKLLVETGNFLVAARRYEGVYPRSWYPDGRAVGWESGVPATGTVSAAGDFLISPLAKLYLLTGDQRYLETAESALSAYYVRYGQDLQHPFWGATLDAGSEDKEAAQGFLHGAIALYEATKNPEYLGWAQDAADWLLTWYYMYDVEFPATAPLHGVLDTVGWTAISVQNEEIDDYGAFLAPDFYRLGAELHDKRYQDIGRTMFEATTQTIARPGLMFGWETVGSQPEHYNQTNCTYVRDGGWRGTFWTQDISWAYAATLYNGTQLVELGALQW